MDDPKVDWAVDTSEPEADTYSDVELFDPDETSVPSKEFIDCTITTKSEPSADEILIRQLELSLSGMQPPPLITMPKYDTSHILQLWKQHVSPNSDADGNFYKGETRLQESLESVLKNSWPEIKHCRFYDINYNASCFSEKLAFLYDKYRARYVGHETASFILHSSPPKRFTKKIVKSPGHPRTAQITRRNKLFSSDSLEEIKSKSSGPQKKTILMDNLSRTKLAEVRRALFTNDQRGKKRPLEGNWIVAKSQLRRGSDQKVTRTPRKGSTPKKYDQSRREEGAGKGVSRKLNFTCSSSSIRSMSLHSGKVDVEAKKADTTRLLWAVSEALKRAGIHSKHELFRASAQKLYALCKTKMAENYTQHVNKGIISIALTYAKTVVGELQKEHESQSSIHN